MSYIKNLTCSGCKKVYPFDELINLCLDCGRPLEIILDLQKLKSEQPNKQWYHPEINSMWRFGALLALDKTNADDAQYIMDLGEGNTPLIKMDKNTLANENKFNLFLKDEGQAHKGYGANPTASFKDRGMAMAVSMARKLGIKKVVVPTQGNAGDSLAEYAMQAKMEVVVIMPDDTPMPILGRVAALDKMNDSVTLELVKGTIREAAALMKQKYVPKGYFNMATFQEPGWRIEGKKTLGLELAAAKEFGQWQLPDVVIYPTGGGTGILGMYKAFDELQALGVIDSKRPKCIAVQSEQTAPVVNAFKVGETDTTAVDPGATLATGLNVPGGVGHFKVLEILKTSNGGAIAVSEPEIAKYLTQTYREYGIWICPEGAATLAAVQPAIDSGLIKAGDNVVAFNTGSFEKYLPDVKHLL
jgi:threonine synthase